MSNLRPLREPLPSADNPDPRPERELKDELKRIGVKMPVMTEQALDELIETMAQQFPSMRKDPTSLKHLIRVSRFSKDQIFAITALATVIAAEIVTNTNRRLKKWIVFGIAVLAIILVYLN